MIRALFSPYMKRYIENAFLFFQTCVSIIAPSDERTMLVFVLSHYAQINIPINVLLAQYWVPRKHDSEGLHLSVNHAI